MTKLTDFDKARAAALSDYLESIKGRAAGNVTNRPFMSDADWEKAKQIIRKRGPLSDAELVIYHLEHDQFARAHLLDLVLDLEHAYTAVALLRMKYGE